MRHTRAAAFASLRQALEFYGLLAGDDPWCEAIRQRLAVLRQRPLTRSELWAINKLVEAAGNHEEACRKIEANNRSEGRLSA